MVHNESDMLNLRKHFSRPKSEYKRIFLIKLSQLLALPVRLKKTKLLNIYLSLQPDSHTRFGSHPEFETLFTRFTKHNKYNAGDLPRLWSFILNCKQIIGENIQGDFAEVGVWRGNTASVLKYYAEKASRKVYLFDTYEGFDSKDLKGVDANKSQNFADTSLGLVKEVLGAEYTDCYFVKGYFPESVTEVHSSNRYAIVSLDCDLYEPTKAGLNFFYERMSCGGIFFLHDYLSKHWSGVKKAVDEFCAERGEFIILVPDKSGSAFLRKTK